jgi:hypothetical protein
MMKSGGGSIALCSSAIAHRGFANHDALAAAKGAVSGDCSAGQQSQHAHEARGALFMCHYGHVRLHTGLCQSLMILALWMRQRADCQVGCAILDQIMVDPLTLILFESLIA